MDGIKQWYRSKAVWGALVAVGASLLQVAGIRLDEAAQADLADILVAFAGAAGGLLALYGRVAAKTAINAGKP